MISLSTPPFMVRRISGMETALWSLIRKFLARLLVPLFFFRPLALLYHLEVSILVLWTLVIAGDGHVAGVVCIREVLVLHHDDFPFCKRAVSWLGKYLYAVCKYPKWNRVSTKKSKQTPPKYPVR